MTEHKILDCQTPKGEDDEISSILSTCGVAVSSTNEFQTFGSHSYFLANPQVTADPPWTQKFPSGNLTIDAQVPQHYLPSVRPVWQCEIETNGYHQSQAEEVSEDLPRAVQVHQIPSTLGVIATIGMAI